VDLFIVDVKSIDKEEYKYITGRDIDEYNTFMNLIQSKNKKIWLRQVVVPSINDDEKHMEDLAKYANSLNGVEKVELLAYHTMAVDKYSKLNIKYRLEGIEGLSNKKLEYLKGILNNNLVHK
jgi:pyruvate formate lyase activating enzyme